MIVVTQWAFVACKHPIPLQEGHEVGAGTGGMLQPNTDVVGCAEDDARNRQLSSPTGEICRRSGVFRGVEMPIEVPGKRLSPARAV